jgi:uncharacterized membrane protein (DUF2068 family)
MKLEHRRKTKKLFISSISIVYALQGLFLLLSTSPLMPLIGEKIFATELILYITVLAFGLLSIFTGIFFTRQTRIARLSMLVVASLHSVWWMLVALRTVIDYFVLPQLDSWQQIARSASLPHQAFLALFLLSLNLFFLFNIYSHKEEPDKAFNVHQILGIGYATIALFILINLTLVSLIASFNLVLSLWLLYSILAIICGFGLFTYKNWGRIGVFLLSTIYLLLYFIYIVPNLRLSIGKGITFQEIVFHNSLFIVSSIILMVSLFTLFYFYSYRKV